MVRRAAKGASTRLVVRLQALLAALRDGPLTLDEALRRLGAAYPPGDSARRMLVRDVAHLAALGIAIEKRSRPVSFTLRGGVPVFRSDELRTLALVRDTFDARHPQARQIEALLGRLTAALTEDERREYGRRTARRAPVRPAIDYAPYASLIEQLEHAIAVRQPVQFRYLPTSGRESRHAYVEPYEIEFYDRHFYLAGYSSLSRQITDFRIDRIRDLWGLDQRLPPGVERQRPLISFRYRLAAALAQGELSQRFETQQIVERLANGDLIVEAQGRSDFFIVQTLLRYRANAELLDPPWLRAKMAEEVGRLAALYPDETSVRQNESGRVQSE
jgi:predicted DNA-binding transcriptional regulator YafY